VLVGNVLAVEMLTYEETGIVDLLSPLKWQKGR
jgi:hypothetical protein